MCRILTIFLLMLLPLQSSWAAMGPYCLHDVAEAPHWGHHSCQPHQMVSESSASDRADTANTLLADHADCHICHAVSPVVFEVHSRFERLTIVEAYRGLMRACQTSPPSNRLERPQWCSLA